jgi:hypothetical protein
MYTLQRSPAMTSLAPAPPWPDRPDRYDVARIHRILPHAAFGRHALLVCAASGNLLMNCEEAEVISIDRPGAPASSGSIKSGLGPFTSPVKILSRERDRVFVELLSCRRVPRSSLPPPLLRQTFRDLFWSTQRSSQHSVLSPRPAQRIHYKAQARRRLPLRF